MSTRFEIVRIDTHEIAHTIETDYSGRLADKVEAGMLRRVDLNRFYVRRVDESGEVSR